MTQLISFEKAASISLAAHVVFFLLATLLAGGHHVREIEVYTVRIMAPEARQSASSQAQETLVPDKSADLADPENRQRIPPPKKAPPPKDKPWLTDDPAPLKVDKKALALKKAALARARHESQLSQRKQEQEQKQQALEQIKQKARLDSIMQQAAHRGEAQKEAPALTSAQRNKALADYGQRIQAIIYGNWVYTLAENDRDLLMARISVTVRRDGGMTINRVVEPSGDRAFDQSAIRAIRKTAKVEPPPFNKDEEILLNFYPDK